MPRLFATAALFVSILSCSENLDSSGVCSVLCPQIGGEVQNITIDAVVVDTTVLALSGLGTEPGLLLASRGDTLDTRVVLRFDSKEAALGWYESPEYQAIVHHRADNAQGVAVLCDGFVMPG